MKTNIASALTLLFASVFTVRGQIYVESGNPYDNGTLTGQIEETQLEADATPGLNVDTLLLWPRRPGTYAVLYFIGGWAGIIPANAYHTVLTSIASHGFIVVGPWPLTSDEDVDVDVAENALKWAKENLSKYTGQAVPSFDHMALGAHSAGSNVQLNLLKQGKTSAKAFVGLEPFSTELEEQVKFNVPGLFLGTELSEYSCSMPGFDFNLFYDNWRCKRVLAEVKGIGHCGIMEEELWEICDVTQRCKTGARALLPSYRRFAQGYVSAFLMDHLQGSSANSKYYTDQSLMPFSLKSFKTDVDC